MAFLQKRNLTSKLQSQILGGLGFLNLLHTLTRFRFHLFYSSYVILAPDTIRPGMEMTVKMNKLSDMVTLALTARVITNNNKLIVGKTANVGAGMV